MMANAEAILECFNTWPGKIHDDTLLSFHISGSCINLPVSVWVPSDCYTVKCLYTYCRIQVVIWLKQIPKYQCRKVKREFRRQNPSLCFLYLLDQQTRHKQLPVSLRVVCAQFLPDHPLPVFCWSPVSKQLITTLNNWEAWIWFKNLKTEKCAM